jgi:hypothetical protein
MWRWSGIWGLREIAGDAGRPQYDEKPVAHIVERVNLDFGSAILWRVPTR